MERPKEKDFEYYQEDVVFKTVNVIQYAKAMEKYNDHIEKQLKELKDENEKHKSRRLVSLKLSMEFRSENQELIKSLEKIRDLTSDEGLPLMKALHQIAHKALSKS